MPSSVTTGRVRGIGHLTMREGVTGTRSRVQTGGSRLSVRVAQSRSAPSLPEGTMA